MHVAHGAHTLIQSPNMRSKISGDSSRFQWQWLWHKVLFSIVNEFQSIFHAHHFISNECVCHAESVLVARESEMLKIEMYDVENYSNVDYNELLLLTVFTYNMQLLILLIKLENISTYFIHWFEHDLPNLNLSFIFFSQKHNCMGRFMNFINIHVILAGK